MISISRALILTADASPGTRRKIWRCKFRMATSKVPEALEPEIKHHRTTASAIYNLPLGHDSNWSNTFVWGQNNDTGEGKTQSFLIESNYQRGRDTVYLRWERVEKSGHELVLNPSDESGIFPVERLHDRLRARLIARQRPRHRARHAIHHSTIARIVSIAITAMISVTRFNFFCGSVRHCIVTPVTSTAEHVAGAEK